MKEGDSMECKHGGAILFNPAKDDCYRLRQHGQYSTVETVLTLAEVRQLLVRIEEVLQVQEASSTVPWYLLYKGTSQDGRGHPSYAGRTQDPATARAFLTQERKSLYTISHVLVVTETSAVIAYQPGDIPR